MNADQLLPEFIATFVPLEIMRLEKEGGPKEAEFVTAKAYWMLRLDAGELDELLFPVKGKTAVAAAGSEASVASSTGHSASMLVSIIACLAFETGGVKIFGHHFVAYEVESPKEKPA